MANSYFKLYLKIIPLIFMINLQIFFKYIVFRCKESAKETAKMLSAWKELGLKLLFFCRQKGIRSLFFFFLKLIQLLIEHSTMMQLIPQDLIVKVKLCTKPYAQYLHKKAIEMYVNMWVCR